MVNAEGPPADGQGAAASSSAADFAPEQNASDSVVALVSHTVVNQRAFMNNCGLPLAAFVDFHPPSKLNLPRIQTRQPLRCKACAAFLNPYCKTNLARHAWKCIMCGQANISKEGLEPLPENYPELGHEAIYPPGSSRRIRCQDPAPGPRQAAAAPTASRTAAPPLPTLPPKTKAPHVVLLIDATVEAEAMQNLRTAAVQALHSMDPKTLLSVVSFDGVVSMHNLAAPSMEASPGGYFSHALPGSTSVEPSMLSFYMQQPGTELVVELGKCLPHLDSLLGCIRPLEQSKPVRQRTRCLLVAVEAALRLSAAHAGMDPSKARHKLPSPTRMLTMLGGPVTMGPGVVPLDLLDEIDLAKDLEKSRELKLAEEHVRTLSSMAQRIGMPIDVFVGGALSVNLPILTTLAQDSGGALVAHESFGPLFAANLQAALSRTFGKRGILDCYTTESPWPADDYSSLVRDRRLSGNACSVSDVQLGHGAALRLELTQDLKEPDIYLQVVLQYIETRTGYMIQQVITRQIQVVTTIGEYLASVQPAVAAVVAGKKLVLKAKKMKAEWYSVAAQLGLIAHRCGTEVQISKGLLGFGAKKAWSLPPELLPLAAALYNFQRGPCIGPLDMHPEEKMYHLNSLLSTGGMVASLALSPQLYLLEFGSTADEDEHTSGTQATKDLDNIQAHPIPSVNVAAHMYSQAGKVLLLDAGTSILVLCPPRRPASTSNSSSHVTPPHAPSPPVPAPLPLSPSGGAAEEMSPGATHGQPDPEFVAAITAHCESQVSGRFPMPELRILSSDSLVPIHRDSLEDQVAQFPGLGSMAVPDIKKLLKPLYTANEEASFASWCYAAEVLPFA
eukprot:gene20834-27666_t